MSTERMNGSDRVELATGRVSRDLLRLRGDLTGSAEISLNLEEFLSDQLRSPQIFEFDSKRHMNLRKLGSSLMVERRLEQRKLGSLGKSGSSVSQTAKPKTKPILSVSVTSDLPSIDTLLRSSRFGQFGQVVDSPKFNISKSNTTTSSTQNGQPRPNLHKLKNQNVHNS